MDTDRGRETDAVRFLAALAKEPYRYDFYQTLRRLECLYREAPRWGCARRPVDEPVRLGQLPELSFAPAPLAALERRDGEPPRLQVRLFGLLGPNGPLPIHLTEYARERLLAHDPTLVRFLDLFHHRFIAYFYRAWAQAQPHVNRDRPASDGFAVYVGSFVGVAPPSLRDRDTVPDEARLFHAGTLMRQVRNADGLAALLRHFFRLPVEIEEFVGDWMRLDHRDLTVLGQKSAVLGASAVAGSRVWDRQHKFRIVLGPLTLDQYESFLPASASTPATTRTSLGRRPLRKLVDWVRFYLCFELDWDVRLVLKAADVPALRLGTTGRLGWTTWLGARRSSAPAADLCLDAEAFADRVGVAA